jgi:hypothetical protein
MASPRIIDPNTPAQQDALPLRHGFLRRVIATVLVAVLGMPPLPLVAQDDPFEEPPLPVMIHWDPLAVLPPDPFAWPPPSQPQLLADLPGQAGDRGDFPSSIYPSQSTTKTGSFASDEPWSPADPGILLPPDGVPVNGNPAGLALLENAVGNGIIVGEISDATTLNPIAGAFVEIVGSGRTAETDAQGRFQFRGLPAGTFNIEASQLGYFSDTTVVTVIEASPSEVRFGLRVKPTDDSANEFTLEEETVVGDYQGDSAGDLFIDLKIDSTVSSGLTKEEFTKTGVSDAAGAVGKIAGANIVGGKFAVVRGLADRYVTTLFNGAAISSADPSRKAVQLDIFPTTAIQSININKTYSPNLPGDFGGGTIQIESLSIPQERIAEFKYKLGTNSNHDGVMYVHPNRELGFWGNVNNPIPDKLLFNLDAAGNPTTFNAGGNRVVPGNTNNASQRQAQLNAGLAQQADANAALPNVLTLHQSQDLLPKLAKPEDSESFSLVYGDKIDFENGNQLGFIAAFQHGTTDEVNAFGPEARLTSPARFFNEESYAREVDWSLYLSGGLKIGEHHELKTTYFKKRIATDNIIHGTDFTIEGDGVFGEFTRNDPTIARYGASAIYKKEFWTIDPVIRDTELFQIGGKHRNDSGTSFSWGISQSTATESRPHTSTFQNGQLDFTDPRIAAQAALDPGFVYNPSLGKISTIEYQTFVNDGIGSLDSTRETASIEEKAREMTASLTQEFYFTDRKEDGPRFELSVGGGKIEKDREAMGRVYLLKTASWERWIARNPPSWWTGNGGIAPFSPGSPLAGTTLADGSPLPAGFNSLGEYLAAHPEALADYFNGYANENFGGIPGTGTASTRANYVSPDAPYYTNGSGLEVRNVDSELTLTSFYTSGTFFGDFWRVGGGGRWEEEVKKYEVAASPLTLLLPGDPSRFGELVTNAFIPSVFAGLDIIPEKSWINFAWSRTVARPTFHEFLPIESIAQDTGILRRGNPDLTETSIDNLDVSLDWVFSESLNGRVSLFRKNLADPIVVVQRVDQGQNSNTYINGDSGTITGIELEGRWKSPDSPWSLTGNYTFIDSTLKYSVNQGINVVDLETRFPFQPSQILNLTLGWEPADGPWKAYLTTNFTDEYPTILRSESSAYDVWLLPQTTFDFTLARSFEFDGFDATLTFGIRNLLNDARTYEYRGGSVSGGGAREGLVYTAEEPGRTYSIEFKAAF